MALNLSTETVRSGVILTWHILSFSHTSPVLYLIRLGHIVGISCSGKLCSLFRNQIHQMDCLCVTSFAHNLNQINIKLMEMH